MDRRLIIINCALLLLTISVGSVPNIISNHPAAILRIPEILSREGEPCNGVQFLSHETDCTAYYMCDHDVLTVKHCAEGLFWAKDHCDWPHNSECHPDYSTTERNEISTEKPLPTTQGPTTTYKPRPPEKDGMRVVCYFTNWAWYRQGAGKYLPEDIDGDLCTHITYGFAVLDENTLTLKPHDSWADIDNNFYKKVVAYQAKGIRVSIALGGWNDSFGPKYSRLANDPAARARFIAHITQFIQEWGFDGLDLDWEYPRCWQNICDQGPESDKAAFAQFAKELHEAFEPRGWLLSAAVSANSEVVDYGYDVPALSKYLNWIAVMCYDYHGQWDKQTGHHSPLYYYPNDIIDNFNANYSMNYWINAGADPKKLILGMPNYGQSFSLADSNEHGLNAKAYGPGAAGEFTSLSGFLAFYEICARVKQGWTVVRDPQGRIGPYAYKDNQWVGYDDIAEFRRKSQYVKANGLGGGMIWALDLDDFRNTCGCGRYPLLRTMNHELRGVPMETDLENCT